MTDKNQERDDLRSRGSNGFRGSENDELDRALDAALSQYAAVTPRSGLEERILANLQAERAQIPERAWWRWGVAATVAVVIVVAVALMWKSGGPTQQQVVQHPAIEQSPKKLPPQFGVNDEHSGARNVITPTPRVVHHPQLATITVATANPKLDVFPSPQPMSEQEKLLAAYIAQFPERAALVAEARMESLRRDEQEMYQGPGADNDF